ncbi:diglucosylglycerate octanoyltransferase [Thalassiella azotivora]
MRLLVLGDSLAFHGPAEAGPVRDPRLWPNVAAARLGGDVDLVARPGWTARDAWWAVTRDPVVWSVLLPRADVLVLAVGGMDALPASLPTWWREGIATLRPDGVRRAARSAYRWAHPWVVRATGGRFRALPQAETDRYLTQVVEGVRYFRPGLPVVVLTPSPWRSPDYPSQRLHAPSVVACRRWAAAHDVALVDVEDVVSAMHARGGGNRDGLHWDWPTHEAVGELVAKAAVAAGEAR